MIRILAFLALVVLVGAGLAWAASLSGELVMMIGNRRIVTSPFVALCALIVLVAAILLIWWLLKGLIRAPHRMNHHFEGRRKERGLQALGQGLIAVMSGDVKAAQRLSRQSSKLLGKDQEPLLYLLAAETKRLEFDHQGAAALFRLMLDKPQMRLIGLKGLYREAINEGEDEAAGRYAAQAAKISPSLEWASRAGIARFAAEGAWEEALLLLERHTKALGKSRAKELDLAHWRVVLMCAQARELAQTDVDGARDIAFKAQRLAPDFIPAATIAAQIAFRLGEQRRGVKLIENLWKTSPHPDLAQVYINASDGSASEKLRCAVKLARCNPANYQSLMLVARCAFEAKNYVQAQKKAQAAAENTASASIFLLLADIEAAQGGNQAKIQQFLARALTAPADPVWIADGQIMPHWVAISPLTHTIGACLWQQPAKAPTTLTLDTARDEKNQAPILAAPIAEQRQEAASMHPPESTANDGIMPDFLPDVEVIDDKVIRSGARKGPVTRLVVDDPGVVVSAGENP